MDSNENSRLSRVAKRREEESRNNPRKPNKNSGLVKKIILAEKSKHLSIKLKRDKTAALQWICLLIQKNCNDVVKRGTGRRYTRGI